MSCLDQPPLSYLSEPQVLAVIRGASPLTYGDREAFFAAVAALLEREQVIGDGVVYRAVKAAQTRFERPQPPVGYPGGWGRRGLSGLYEGMSARDRVRVLLTLLNAPRVVELPGGDVERAQRRRRRRT